MNAAVITASRVLEVISTPLPQPGPAEVRVQLEGCGVCASNLPVWEGREWFRYPLQPGAPGHEGWGYVEALGDGVENVAVGDRVAFLSERAYAEFDIAKSDALVRIPDRLARRKFPGEALGCAMNIFRRAEIEAGQTVAVIGAGFLGNLLVQLAKSAGAYVIAISRREAAREIAKACGADETLHIDDFRAVQGAQRVIECVGSQQAIDIATQIIGERGRLVIAGYHQDGLRQVNLQHWNWLGIDVVNAHERDPRNYVRGMEDAVAAVLDGRIDPDPLLTHSYGLHELNRALDDLATRPGDFVKGTVLLEGGRPARLAAGILPGAGRERLPGKMPGRCGRDARTPKLAFAGLGWIGRHRMNAVTEAGVAEAAYTCDIDTELSFDDLLASDADGIVIATPSAMHAEQAVAALERGKAVFCQKPLGRNAEETRRVVEAARRNDRLLGVDLSYRHTDAMRAVKKLVDEKTIGDVYAVNLVLHNAYGPDKPWFYDAKLAGGGCVIDLGIHLVDLALWTLGFPKIARTHARLHHHGGHDVEDYATALMDLENAATIELACSWNVSAGRDCEIRATFYGTRGAAALRNMNGSFYDFVADHHQKTQTTRLTEPGDAWGGRAIVAWAEQLARGNAFDPEVEPVVEVAEALDAIYRSARR